MRSILLYIISWCLFCLNANAQKQVFTEGYLKYSITIGDKTMLKLLEFVAKDKTPSMASFEKAKSILSKEEIDHIQNLTQKNPSIGMSLLILPYFGDDIWIQKDKVLAKAKAFTYSIENYWDQSSGFGKCYLVSNVHPEKNLTYDYDKNYTENNKVQTYIGSDKFEIQRTNEKVTIAGFEAYKTIYTRKSSVTAHNLPYKLEVYESPQMSQAVNFSHPYYTEEENGIVKINAYLSKDAPPLTYELVKAENKNLSPSQMNIHTSKNVFPTKTLLDQATLGFQVLGLMMDTGQQQAENEDEPDDSE